MFDPTTNVFLHILFPVLSFPWHHSSLLTLSQARTRLFLRDREPCRTHDYTTMKLKSKHRSHHSYEYQKPPSTSSHVSTLLHIRTNGYSTTALSKGSITLISSHKPYTTVTSQKAVDMFVRMQWYTRHAGVWGYPGWSTQLPMRTNYQSFILAKMLVAWRRTEQY